MGKADMFTGHRLALINGKVVVSIQDPSRLNDCSESKADLMPHKPPSNLQLSALTTTEALLLNEVAESHWSTSKRINSSHIPGITS